MINLIALCDFMQISTADGASDDEISEAVQELGLPFPDEYIQFLSHCGHLSYGGREVLGLNNAEGKDTVSTTEAARATLPGFPEDALVMEEMKEIRMLLLADGRVMRFRGGRGGILYPTFGDYLKNGIFGDFNTAITQNLTAAAGMVIDDAKECPAMLTALNKRLEKLYGLPLKMFCDELGGRSGNTAAETAGTLAGFCAGVYKIETMLFESVKVSLPVIDDFTAIDLLSSLSDLAFALAIRAEKDEYYMLTPYVHAYFEFLTGKDSGLPADVKTAISGEVEDARADFLRAENRKKERSARLASFLAARAGDEEDNL